MKGSVFVLLLLPVALKAATTESSLQPNAEDNEFNLGFAELSPMTAVASDSDIAAVTETEIKVDLAASRRRRTQTRRRRRSKESRRRVKMTRRRRRSKPAEPPKEKGRRRRSSKPTEPPEESGRRRRRNKPTEPPKEKGRRRRSNPTEPPDESRRRSKPPPVESRRRSAPTPSKPMCWETTPKMVQNPFIRTDGKTQTFYVNPSYRKLLDTSIATAKGSVKTTLKKMANVPSAFWIDVKSKVFKKNSKLGKNVESHDHPDISTVEGILEDAAKCDPPHLVLFMVYDLPNRDCFALASNGEICCHYGKDLGRTSCEMASNGFYKEYPGDGCKAGMKEYRDTYIDPFVKVVKEFNGKVPIVLVIEPDGLPNMITNMADSDPPYGGLKERGCHAESKAAYMDGISYTVNKFGDDTDATMYLDAGHGGWLGWANSPESSNKPYLFSLLIKEMSIHTKMRGFATNVANYQPIGDQVCPEMGTCIQSKNPNHACCSKKNDPCDLKKSWNWGHNELNYVDVLADRARKVMPDWDVKFIVDTGRNGRPEARTDCSNWCNPRGNGIGHVPTTKTGHPRIDAYYWLKTPGESDGCTEDLPEGGKCARFDKMCKSEDSIGSKSGEPRAPEAGLWFDHQIKELAQYADLGDPELVKLYQGGSQCRDDSGKCGNIAGKAPTMPPPTLGPGKCEGNDGRCASSTSRKQCYGIGCKWSGCCGGNACAPKDYNWKCKAMDESGCKSDSTCKWEQGDA